MTALRGGMSGGGAPPRTAPPGAVRLRARGPLDWLAIAFGSCLFTGFSPVAPATVASAAVAILLAFVYPLPNAAAYVGLCLALLVSGAWASTRIERMFGHDPSAATIDEVLGMAITLAGVAPSPATVVLGFLLFRVFDIVKVAPGRALERLPGGWGVMADDACAGVYAAVVLRVILHFWPEPRLEAWQAVVLGAATVPLLVFRKRLLRKYGKKPSRLGDAVARAADSTRP